jgi:hypothetical protein
MRQDRHFPDTSGAAKPRVRGRANSDIALQAHERDRPAYGMICVPSSHAVSDARYRRRRTARDGGRAPARPGREDRRRIAARSMPSPPTTYGRCRPRVQAFQCHCPHHTASSPQCGGCEIERRRDGTLVQLNRPRGHPCVGCSNDVVTENLDRIEVEAAQERDRAYVASNRVRLRKQSAASEKPVDGSLQRPGDKRRLNDSRFSRAEAVHAHGGVSQPVRNAGAHQRTVVVVAVAFRSGLARVHRCGLVGA